MKKRLLLGSLIVICLAVIIVLAFNLIGGVNEEEVELTPEVMEFIEYYKQWIDFDHPYVECIFDKTCEGTFHLGMGASLKENKSQIEEFLNKYGKVKRISEFDYYSISFETDNIYKIGPILNSSSFNDVVLYGVKSDYNFEETIDGLYSCNVDSDCAPVRAGCCGCSSGGESTLINKNYVDDWNSYQSLACLGTGCVAMLSGHLTCLSIVIPKCMDNSCKFANHTDVPCEVPYYSSCRHYVPKSEWNASSFGYSGGGVSCREIIDMCEGGMSPEEVYNKCLNEVEIPEDYIEGYVIAGFDSNSTEEEINDYVSNSKFKIERRLDDYGYFIGTSGKSEKEDFINYLNSFPEFLREIIELKDGSGLFVWFYGNISMNNSKELIGNYEGPWDINTLSAQRGRRNMGLIEVPKGEEKEWICRLGEEEILYQVEAFNGKVE